MIYRRVLVIWVAMAVSGSYAQVPPELSVGDISMPPSATATVAVSGSIDGHESNATFGVTILVEIVPRCVKTGTLEFTPAPPVDIVQLGSPWPDGQYTAYDVDLTGSPFLNGSVDDSGGVAEPVLFSGPLSGFPVVAGADAEGVWDVVLSTPFGDSSWQGLPTTLVAGGLTVTSDTCEPGDECDDGNVCTDDACDESGACEHVDTGLCGACYVNGCLRTTEEVCVMQGGWFLGPGSECAREHVYWTDRDTDTILRADLDGSNVEALVTDRLEDPAGIALDITGKWMYWAGSDRIQRAPLDGACVEDLVTAVPSAPSGVALDLSEGKIYWTDLSAEKIQRANLDGSSVEELVTEISPVRIALDTMGGKMYWTDFYAGKIQRANLNGTSVEDVITGQSGPREIVLDVERGKVYWTNAGGLSNSRGSYVIKRSDLDGGNEEVIIGDGCVSTGITIDLEGEKIYWNDGCNAEMRRANLDGLNVEVLFGGVPRADGMALDLAPVPLLPAIPTLCEWGMVTMTLIILVTGTVLFRERKFAVV
jgi:sugar lactone lactonase YvrE